MHGTIKAVLGEIKNERVNLLVSRIINRHYDAFISQPAACGNHHAYTGGLLVHSARVALLGGDMCSFYKDIYDVNRDIVIAGGFLHDIGKVHCYKTKNKQDGTKEFESTQMSRLHHHIPIGYHLVAQVAEEIALNDSEMALNPDDLNRLLHIIVSHHGRVEYRSPRRPKTDEAFLVSQADMIDAYMDADKAHRQYFGRGTIY